MNKYAYGFIGLLLLSIGCSNTKQEETPNGLKYTILEEGDTTVAKVDEVLVFDYQLKDSKDSIWGETFTDGIPGATKIADTSQIKTEDGMTQMFRMLSPGDSVKTEMPVTEFFTKIVGAPAPPDVDTTLSVTYTVKVRDIMSVEEFMKAREVQLKEREKKIFSRDADEIAEYLKKHNITALQDTSGLRYVLYNNEGGEKPTVDDCVEVKYKGTFMKTGEVFDQSDKISFPLDGVISGWKLGIPMLGKGDSAVFFIPSKLGYGPQGYPGAIPPDAILIFNVTLLDVKSEFDQATRTCK